MMKKIPPTALLLACALVGCTVNQINDQEKHVAKFRETRSLYNKALLRCEEIANKKYHGQLYGSVRVEGEARVAVSRGYEKECRVCADNYDRKMRALWDAQPADVHAFYEQRRAELHQENNAVNEEAKR